MKRFEDINHSSKVDNFNALLVKILKDHFSVTTVQLFFLLLVSFVQVYISFLEDFLLFSVVRLELETRLAALEQQRALQDAADHAQKEEWEERLRSAQQGEESARRELQNLRSALH